MNKLLNLLFALFLMCVFASCVTTGSGKTRTLYEFEMTGEVVNSDYLESEISYPVFKDFPDLNNRIKNLVVNPYQAFSKTAKTEWTEINKLNSKNNGSIRLPPFEYNVTSEVFETPDYISVLISEWVFNGGAHGNTVLISVNYDVTNRKYVNISEVTGLNYNQISGACRSDLRKKLEVKEFINDGTEPNPGNFEIFVVKDGNIVTVYFEPYSVAPYYLGVQKVDIQYR